MLSSFLSLRISSFVYSMRMHGMSQNKRPETFLDQFVQLLIVCQLQCS